MKLIFRILEILPQTGIRISEKGIRINIRQCLLCQVCALVAQWVKHLPPMQETWVRSLGWEGPLEKEMATHSSTLAWKIPWMEEPGGPQSMGSLRVGHD